MSVEETAVEQAQNAPEEFAETQNQQVDTSKLFSKAYNEGKSKLEKDVLKMFNTLGLEDVESIEQGFSTLNERLSPKKNAENEVETLRKLLDESNKKMEDLQGEFESFMKDSQVDRTVDTALQGLKGKADLSIKDDHLKTLFFMEYEVEEREGQFIAVKDGTPIMNSKGDYLSLSDALYGFARDNKYLSPRATGTGGGTGSAGVADKPSRTEFRNLLRTKSADSQARAADMFATAKKTGWAD
jgi:hypothetical protein